MQMMFDFMEPDGGFAVEYRTPMGRLVFVILNHFHEPTVLHRTPKVSYYDIAVVPC